MKLAVEGGEKTVLVLSTWLFLRTALCYAETYNLTVYQSNEVSWYEAEMFCESEGSRLIKLNDTDKHSSFLEFIDNLGYSNEIFPHIYWTGMHSTDNNNCGKYYWADCDINTFSNWKPGSPEPDSCQQSKCVRLEDTYHFTTRCNDHHRFICEKMSMTISFETFMNTDVSTSGFTFIDVYNKELPECLDFCSNAMFDSLRCWVVKVIQYGVKCQLLFTNDAYSVDTTSYSSSGTHLYVRRRFGVNIISNSVSLESITGMYSTCPVVRPLPTTTFTTPITTEQTTTAPDPTTPGVQCTTLQPTTETKSSTYNPTTTTTTTTTQHQTTTSTTAPSPLSDTQLQEKLISLVAETKVDAKSTNADARKKNCAEDTRTSSVSIGLIAGGILGAISAAIVLADIPTLLKDAGIPICTSFLRN